MEQAMWDAKPDADRASGDYSELGFDDFDNCCMLHTHIVMYVYISISSMYIYI